MGFFDWLFGKKTLEQRLEPTQLEKMQQAIAEYCTNNELKVRALLLQQDCEPSNYQAMQQPTNWTYQQTIQDRTAVNTEYWEFSYNGIRARIPVTKVKGNIMPDLIELKTADPE